MKRHGFIKVCAATTEIKVADVPFNVKGIASAANKAAEEGAQLVVFPELCVSGYTCGDLFNQRALTEGVLKGLEYLKSNIAGGALVFVARPWKRTADFITAPSLSAAAKF